MKTSDVLIFSAGFVAGGLASWAFLKKKFDERIDEERAILREAFNQTVSHTSNVEKPQEQAENSPKTHSEGYDRQSMIDKMNNLTKIDPESTREYQNYSSYYGGDDVSDEENVKEKRLNQLASQEHPTDNEYPYIIDEDEYANPDPAYEKMTVNYFMDDDVLIDALSHEMIDIKTTVGSENIAYLRTSEDDILYVRNDKTGFDYEIERLFSDYEETERGYNGFY